MDKKKEKMTPERRYELACLILGGVVLGGALGCILRPNEWTFAVIPLPGNVTGLDDVLAESVIILTLLAGTVFVPAAALGLGVASVLAAVVHLRRTPAAETRAYREGPLALALVLCVGVAALCVCFFLYLTI